MGTDRTAPTAAFASDRAAQSVARALPITPVGHEDHVWMVDPDGPYSRSERARASGPYRSTVPARIADYSAPIPLDLGADIEEAAQALSTFDSHAAATLGLDNPALGPMSSILLRTESASSSRIENLTVGARQLALAELAESQSANASAVLGNVRAMEAALRLADRLDEANLLAMHNELLAREPGWEAHAGRYRDGLVWVGTSRAGPRGASHVAPQPDRIRPAMADLVAFMARDDLPILAQAAIAHAQFETIHPFSDGNGRAGRALIHALLQNKGALQNMTAPVSAGLLTDTSAYFDALTAFRAGDARAIVESFTRATRYAASSGARLVDDLAEEIARSREQLAGLRPQAAAWTVLPRLVGQPVVNARYLTSVLGFSNMTAQRALVQLADAGVLEERTGLRRNRVWQHAGILAVLDAYAEGLRRL